MNQLAALKQWTTVVADTGDFKELAAYRQKLAEWEQRNRKV